MTVDLHQLEQRWREIWQQNPPLSPIRSTPAASAPIPDPIPESAPVDAEPAATAEESSGEESSGEESSGEESSADETAVDETAADEKRPDEGAFAADLNGADSSSEEPIVEEAVIEESVTDEAVIEETSGEQSTAEKTSDDAESADDGQSSESSPDPSTTASTDDFRPFYCLDMFPYPSLDGFSVNQLRGIAINDVVARYQKARGRDVFRPIGWDSFGLSIEEEARASGLPPKQVVEQGIEKMRDQLNYFGAMVHWDHELNSSDPDCYRWSQWIFLKLHEKGLVRYENGWKVAITDYAEPLHTGLKQLKWPARTKLLQRNWIGRREGTRLTLKASAELHDGWEEIDVFSRRIDALADATFVVLSPEHPLLEGIVDAIQRDDVIEYIEKCRQLSERDRVTSRGAPDGVPTGAYCLNPVTLDKMPIWVSSYVLPEIRFGAILGIPSAHPAHLEFANNFGLPHTRGSQQSGRRRRRSGRRRGSDGGDSARSIQSSLESRDLVESHVDWKLHDWAFERQRIWGEPIPIIECDECGKVPVPEDQLPVLLPEIAKVENSSEGSSPLAAYPQWVDTTCPGCGAAARRCTDTMPDWIASCWTHLRSLDPTLVGQIAAPELVQQWAPVNLCVGGIEHAELHLLYVRFISHFLKDLGITRREEPFRRLFSQGRIRSADVSESADPATAHRGPRVLAADYLERYGADAMRLHLLFLGPAQDHAEWNEEGLRGCARFLQRTHEAILARVGEGRFVSRDVLVAKHRLIRRVSRAIRTFRLNKAVSAFMEFVKLLRSDKISMEEVDRQTLKTFVVLLAPFAPHMAHELWEGLGETDRLDEESWPEHSEELLQPSQVSLAVQVNEKIVDRITVDLDAPKNLVIDQALKLESVVKKTGGRPADRVVHVPDRLLKLIYTSDPGGSSSEPETVTSTS
ncbi:MAG: class I tRNA ligase family protein [Planctomycetes bacterium]|nr:class I tRNA ligase family protein [Planctomycetota bacterium]